MSLGVYLKTIIRETPTILLLLISIVHEVLGGAWGLTDLGVLEYRTLYCSGSVPLYPMGELIRDHHRIGQAALEPLLANEKW